MTIYDALDEMMWDDTDLRLDELQEGMAGTRTMMDACRAAGDHARAESHGMWLDTLLATWTERATAHHSRPEAAGHTCGTAGTSGQLAVLHPAGSGGQSRIIER